MINKIFFICLIVSITFAKSPFVITEKTNSTTSLTLEIEMPILEKD